MGFVVTITQRKGGAGKTTVACQLAAALRSMNYRVTGIDLDDQGSFSFWAKTRRRRKGDDPAFRFEAPAPYGLWTALRTAKASSDFAIIDTAPAVDLTVKRAVRECDLAITPMQLTPLDLDATLPTARLLGEEARAARFLVNRTPPKARIADEIRAQIGAQGLPLFATEFGNRAAFAESLARGEGAVEAAPSSLAADEARRLAREVMACAGRSLAAA